MSRISASSSRIPRSVSSRWACSASTCSRASSYSLLGQRVDRADLGPAPLQPLEPAVDLGPLLVAQRLLGRRDLLAEPLGDRGQLLARPRRGGRRGGRPRPRPRSARRRPPSSRACSSNSLLRAGAHLLGDLVAVALAADDLALDPLDPGPDRRLRRPRPRRAAARTSSSSSSPAATRARSASRWRSPSRPSARRAWREARSAPPRTAPSAASRADSAASAERARARPSPAVAQAGLDLAQLLLQLARPLAGAPRRRRRRASAARARRAAPPARPRARPRGSARLGGADRDPLLLAAQLGQQAPGLGALAVAGGEALLGGAAALADLGQPLLELVARRRAPSPPPSRAAARAVGAEAQLLGDQLRPQPQLLASRSARPARPPAPGASAAAAAPAPRARRRGRGRGCRAPARSFSSARRRRLRCLPRPAASSTSSRRSRGLEWTIVSTRPWLITECISRPRLVSERTSTTSARRQRAPLSR